MALTGKFPQWKQDVSSLCSLHACKFSGLGDSHVPDLGFDCTDRSGSFSVRGYGSRKTSRAHMLHLCAYLCVVHVYK